MTISSVRTTYSSSPDILGESKPFVSVIMPCRNEQKYVGKCLDSIIASDYPKDRMEVLVVDGMSDDGTEEIVGKYVNNYPFIKRLDNSKRITPAALNIGILRARGEIIIRMDAHNIYEDRYISKCVEHLLNNDADNVGGVWITLPGGNTRVARSIALALSHPFGIGNARFRTGVREPVYVDTVPFGCYRRDVFRRIGLFDEDLIRNQDDEFNFRLIKSGGTVMLIPDIVSHYYARDSLSKLWRMYFQYGYFKPLVASKVKSVLTWRQIVPALFVGGLIGTFIAGFVIRPFLWISISVAILYTLVNVYFSFRIARKRGLDHFLGLVASFFTLHCSYGLGYLRGIWDFVLKKNHKRRRVNDVPLTR